MSLSILDESIIWDKDTNNFVIMRKFLLFLTIIFNYISLFSFSCILFPVFYRQLCDFMHSCIMYFSNLHTSAIALRFEKWLFNSFRV